MMYCTYYCIKPTVQYVIVDLKGERQVSMVRSTAVIFVSI